MKRSLLAASLALAVAICLIGIVPLANAAAGDSTIFFMTKSAGAVPCLNAAASGRGTISDLGPVQNMHVEVSNLPANTEFTLFVINTPSAPFVPAWYQGDLKTNAIGRGVLDVTGIFSAETFILNPGVPAVPVNRKARSSPKPGRLRARLAHQAEPIPLEAPERSAVKLTVGEHLELAAR